ncbi:MAG TPA: hypothetical protein VK915_06930 [Gaiellaceae bacterium]|nr:hypothetical protein [Gaiellaceae bacterium]
MDAAGTPRPPAEDAGWVHFAGLLVVLIGAFNVVNGLTGLLRETTFLVTPDGLLVSTDYKVWGGFWLGLGAVQVLAGLGVLGGRQWARVAAVLLLLVAAVGQMLFLVAFPLWSLLTIGLIVAAIHALTVHGQAFGR